MKLDLNKHYLNYGTHTRSGITKGVEAHKAGKAQEADRYYTAILKASILNILMLIIIWGFWLLVLARYKMLSHFLRKLEVNSNIAQFWLSYIDALIKLDRMADAKAVLNQAKANGAKGDSFDQLEKKRY